MYPKKYTFFRLNFGTDLSREPRSSVKALTVPRLALVEGPCTPAPPKALPKFGVRKVYFVHIPKH